MHELTNVGQQMVHLDVAQRSKIIWTAKGTVFGSVIVVSATSCRTAINRWRRAAENRMQPE